MRGMGGMGGMGGLMAQAQKMQQNARQSSGRTEADRIHG